MNDNHSEDQSTNPNTGYLVLTRRVGEGVLIDCNGVAVEIIVSDRRGGNIRLSIKAPRTSKISRTKGYHKGRDSDQ